jgi:hypothetical protein
MCKALGDKTNILFYYGNRLSDTWSPYGLKKLGIENAPPFFTRDVVFDVQAISALFSITLLSMFHFVGSRTINKRQLPTHDRSARFHKCGAIAPVSGCLGDTLDF